MAEDFMTFKMRVLDVLPEGNKLLSTEQVDLEIFEYIEIFYNRIRRYSALKNMTIDENY